MQIQINIIKKNISDDEERKDNNLPGAKTHDVTKRSSKKVPVQVHSIEFSQSNK
jgi:hypothetical protein